LPFFVVSKWLQQRGCSLVWTDKYLNFLCATYMSSSSGLKSVFSFKGSTLNESQVWSL
jgi:hypothetical protein